MLELLNFSTVQNYEIMNEIKNEKFYDSCILDTISTSQLKTEKYLKKGSQSKFLTRRLCLALIQSNPDSILKKSYWNTYHCIDNISVKDGNMSAKSCKNRWCFNCNRKKTVKYYKAYSPAIKEFKEPIFMTLTVKNVKYDNLNFTLSKMLKVCQNITNNNKNRKIFKGLRKLEITYNPNTDEYHPHFHFIVEGYSNAVLFRDLWLNSFVDADIRGQDIKFADENSLIEMFKYFTKIIQKDVDINNVSKVKVYPVALNNILIALKGRRIFQSFGIKIKEPDENELNEKDFEVEKLDKVNGLYSWMDEMADWCNFETGVMLADYKISKSLEEIGDSIHRVKKNE